MTTLNNPFFGLALLDKPKDKTSFYLVSFLRRLTNIRCIGHAGTLDPFATGLMVMLIGRPYTKLSNRFLLSDKEYLAKVYLGATTDTYDVDGQIKSTSDKKPTLLEIETVLPEFQGDILQCPPMYSAKKVQGKKLYELARKGIEIERASKKVSLEIDLISYNYPYLELYVKCSSGTYIRSLAYDLGQRLGCGAYLEELTRTKVGPFSLEESQPCSLLTDPSKLQIRRQF